MIRYYVRSFVVAGAVGLAGSVAFGWWSMLVTTPLAAAIGISLGRDATREHRGATEVEPPRPPEGVKIVRANGEVVPLELIYVGYVGGMHQWNVVTAAVFHPFDGDRLAVDVLPAHTGISFTVIPNEGHDHEG